MSQAQAGLHAAVWLPDLSQLQCRSWAGSWAGAAMILAPPVFCLLGRQHAPVAALGIAQAVSLCGLMTQVCL